MKVAITIILFCLIYNIIQKNNHNIFIIKSNKTEPILEHPFEKINISKFLTENNLHLKLSEEKKIRYNKIIINNYEQNYLKFKYNIYYSSLYSIGLAGKINNKIYCNHNAYIVATKLDKIIAWIHYNDRDADTKYLKNEFGENMAEIYKNDGFYQFKILQKKYENKEFYFGIAYSLDCFEEIKNEHNKLVKILKS
jgi:hypothetical protein